MLAIFYGSSSSSRQASAISSDVFYPHIISIFRGGVVLVIFDNCHHTGLSPHTGTIGPPNDVFSPPPLRPKRPIRGDEDFAYPHFPMRIVHLGPPNVVLCDGVSSPHSRLFHRPHCTSEHAPHTPPPSVRRPQTAAITIFRLPAFRCGSVPSRHPPTSLLRFAFVLFE